MKPAGQILGDYIASFATIRLDPDIREKALICLLDTLGLSLSAATEPTTQAALALSYPLKSGGATAWASGARLAASEAAFANGVAAHAHFQDDTDHDSWTHPGSLISPVAVSLGEALDAPLGTVLKALTAGYATLKWLGAGEAVARGLIGRGIRTSPTFGTIGAAAAGAVLLGLDAAKAANAIGIAACTTGGTLEPVRCGSDEWRPL